jgi:hypothetical protein
MKRLRFVKRLGKSPKVQGILITDTTNRKIVFPSRKAFDKAQAIVEKGGEIE